MAKAAGTLATGELGSSANTFGPVDLRLLSDLPSLALKARYLMTGYLSGRHRSPYRGYSVEFAEYRQYQLGDDLRRIDWRLFGRTDRLHVKQYEDEVQLRLFLGLDLSASMDFRSREGLQTKLEFSRVLIAALTLLASRQRDAFGLGLFGAELLDVLRGRSSQAHWRALIAKLDAVTPSGGSSIAKAASEWTELLPQRSLVMLISDFYEGVEKLEPVLRRLRYDCHDVVLVQVLDPMELEFDSEVFGTFIDAETGGRMDLDSEAVRQGYLERFGKFRAELEDLARSVGGDLVTVRTDEAPFQALEEYLRRRDRTL